MSSLIEHLAQKKVIVCCGPGGVGKTTVSAALALRLAEAGNRVCVLTIDPARRLSNALGMEHLSNEPEEVPGVTGGALYAAMLSSAATFDALIDTYAPSAHQAEHIKANRLYQNLSSSLSGMQEYMAIEKLNALTASGDFDLVVLDTPPTRNALDVITAPSRLTRFLEHRVFRALLSPTSAYLRAISVASRSLLKTLGAVAGAELVEDAIGFFQAFAGMEQGFAQRATAMRELLASPDSAYVLVSSPRADAIEETLFFSGQLVGAGLSSDAIVINRLLSGFAGPEVPSSLLERDDELGRLARCTRDLRRAAEEGKAAVEDLGVAMAPSPVLTLGVAPGDLHSLSGLRKLGLPFAVTGDDQGQSGILLGS